MKLSQESETLLTLKQIQDYLCPRLDAYEQMLYHYLYRHSHLEGSPECIVGARTLRLRVGLGTGMPGKPPSANQIRIKIRSLENKEAIEIRDRGRDGTRIRVFLPEEISDCVPLPSSEKTIDIESIDFSQEPYRKFLLLRENKRCFYCFSELKDGRYEIDHVVPSSKKGTNSYRNLVAACSDCNNNKREQNVEDFLRTLFRQNLISREELNTRIKTISELREGVLKPPLPDDLG